ncbi:MAG: hypothetical protein WBM02_06330 [bacterium]
MTASADRWKKFKSKLSSAFKVESEEDWEPNDRQKAIVEKLAKWVVNHRLTLPAIMTLESVTPLNFLGNQAMVFFHPFVSAFLDTGDYKEFQNMLEYRKSIGYMIQVLEAREEEFDAKRKADKAARRKSAAQGESAVESEVQDEQPIEDKERVDGQEA